ncbi:uncharacterized protein LOC133467605 isoform X2 [Phyllopteryx taeniolatus]|uniref:uncharacterized protein LOC133467605 isoform X2 n=1 Tax=Phyllopteryx taeniolatus TaxID=161469 RepID=UPI002AD49502|nr:uncharacterized protein LOC133467605 isoform X2 [Phyllopteryx taeniolatus]
MFGARRAVKADTPLRAPLKRRHGRGRHPCQKFQALPEEEPQCDAVAGPAHVRTSGRALRCKSQFPPSSNNIWPIPSAGAAAAERVGAVTLGHPGCQVRPSPPQTGPTGTTSENSSDSSDDDDFWDSLTSSSVPSPEIFRHDSMFDFFSEDVTATPGDVRQPRVKNSTLLGRSHVESIQRHRHPNVSTVLYAPSILVNTKGQMSDQGATADNPQTHSDESLKGNSRKSALARRPLSYRKVQRFKSPFVAEQKDASSLRKKQPPKVDGAATFFHFDDDSIRKEFFRQARERHAKLTG